MNACVYISIYWSFTVPGGKWQCRGVIRMFYICQRNAESMIKQWHTLYGYAVRPEKVSWTTVLCRVSRCSPPPPPFDASGPLGHNSIPSLPISPMFFSLRWPKLMETYDGSLGGMPGGERWLCALPVSLSFCSFVLHCCLNLMDLLVLWRRIFIDN